MKKAQGWMNSRMWFAAVGFLLVVAGTAAAQINVQVFTAKFTLTNQVQWEKIVLQPGNYTISIGAFGPPMSALVRDEKGRAVGFFSGIDDGAKSSRNALLLKEKGGQLRVYSMALGSLGSTLVYDKALEREAALEARAPQFVPVTLAQR